MEQKLGSTPIQTVSEHPPFPNARSAYPYPHFVPPHIPMPHGEFPLGVLRATSRDFRLQRARARVRSNLESLGDLASGPLGSLLRWQRTPQYVVPLGNQHPISPDTQRQLKEDPDAYFAWALDSGAVFGFKESTISAFSVTPEERERIYEAAWEKGNGFAFMLEHFADIVTSKEANDTATDFVRSKIAKIVKDLAVAAKLSPHDLYAKRPLAVDNYYEVFNRDNVTLVDIKSDPIKTITETGLDTMAESYDLDALAIATGFDAMTGNYLKIETIGRNGERLQDKWRDGPQTFGGVSIAGFPNLFMVFGPMGPFTSQPLVHEWQIKWFTKLIKHALENGLKSIEAEKEAEKEWCKLCFEIADQTLFPQCDSWINGANIPGKPKVTMWYMGGMANYAAELERMANDGYKEYRFD